jgi:hypothetical protein
MEPEQSPTPNNDVDSIRRDAATPLHYRSAVRALLGMPEAEGENPTFARMVPPVGFQYHLPSPIDETSHSPHDFEDTVPSALDEAQTRELPSSEGILAGTAPASWPIEALRKWLLDTPPPSPPTTAVPRPSTLEQHTAPPQDAGATSEQDREFIAPPATAGQEGGVREHITIAVPGISERSQYFPALAPENPTDRPASMTTERYPRPLAPENPTDRPASTATEPSPRQIVPSDPPRQIAERLLSPDQVQTSLPEVASKIQARASQNEATPPVDLRPRPLPSPTMKEGEARSIGQLQRMVRDLAAQVASWQTRMAHESQRQQTEQRPPRRPERVVIIKQAAQPSGSPRAFWERSYLSRLSWRTMR